MEKIRMQSVNLQKANAVMAEVKKAVIGKDTCILKVMAAELERPPWHWLFQRPWI